MHTPGLASPLLSPKLPALVQTAGFPELRAVWVPKSRSHFTQQPSCLLGPTPKASFWEKQQALPQPPPPTIHTLPRSRISAIQFYFQKRAASKQVAAHEMESLTIPELEECVWIGSVLLANPWSTLPHLKKIFFKIDF